MDNTDETEMETDPVVSDTNLDSDNVHIVDVMHFDFDRRNNLELEFQRIIRSMNEFFGETSSPQPEPERELGN